MFWKRRFRNCVCVAVVYWVEGAGAVAEVGCVAGASEFEALDVEEGGSGSSYSARMSSSSSPFERDGKPSSSPVLSRSCSRSLNLLMSAR